MKKKNASSIDREVSKLPNHKKDSRIINKMTTFKIYIIKIKLNLRGKKSK